MKKIFIVCIIFLLYQGCVFSQNTYRNWVVRNNTNTKKYIALVIGNNKYKSNGNLINPIPTAKKLEKELPSLGFDVLIGTDLNRQQMVDMIENFSHRIKPYQVAMIFYMGHGFEIGGENYLIPIDANPQNEAEVKLQAINVDDMLESINHFEKPKIIVFDACRENPFVRNENWTSKYKSSGSNGFGDIIVPHNSEVFFSIQKGVRVSDDNPYMTYFLEELQEGNCLDDIARNIAKRVKQADPKQITAKYGQLLDKVCFGSSPQPSPNNDNKDNDNDGIINKFDKCPNTYGSAEKDGCPSENSKTNEWIDIGTDFYKQKRYEVAFQWYEKAAKAGNVTGQSCLGYMYNEGVGVAKDYQESIFWYKKAAEQGDIDGQNGLGTCYQKGEGVDINYKMAVYWYKKAAEQGSSLAQFNLGVMYEHGRGVERDNIKAKYWYDKSCDQSYINACTRLINLD